MKIVVTDAKTITNGDISLDFLEKYGELVIYDLTPADALSQRIKDADMILVNKAVIGEKEMDAAKNLKYIGLFATGYNNIDTAAADRHGITVCNAGSYSTNAVAQQVFSFILGHANRTAEYNSFVQDGGWKKSDTFSPFVFPICELEGKTVGIVGYGSIGKRVADIAKAFGMKILVYTRTPKEDEGVIPCDFDTLLGQSDYVTVHCPLNAQSEHMFDAAAFKKMKKTAYFINTARGGVVVETDLADAVKNKTIAGAGVDVLTVEPMSGDCQLCGIENLTVTPHISWAPLETRLRLMGIVEDNIKSFIEGSPQNVVNDPKFQ